MPHPLAGRWSRLCWHPWWRAVHPPLCQICPLKPWCSKGGNGGYWRPRSGWCGGSGRQRQIWVPVVMGTGSSGVCSLPTPSACHRNHDSAGRASPQCLETSRANTAGVGRKLLRYYSQTLAYSIAESLCNITKCSKGCQFGSGILKYFYVDFPSKQ